MNGLPYYKAYPRDFLDGTAGMDFEVKGAYRLVLDLIYMHGGRLVDDPRFIAGNLGCSVKKWNGLRAAILATGKIVVSNGYLGNLRADKELDSLKSFQTKQRENGSQPKKNNGLTKAVADPKANHTDTDTYTVSKDTAADAAVDPSKLAFDAGVAMLTKAGKSPGSARSLIGKWVKAHKAEAVIVALGRAQREGAVDPVAFIEGVFKATKAAGVPNGTRRQLADGRWQSFDTFNGWVNEHV